MDWGRLKYKRGIPKYWEEELLPAYNNIKGTNFKTAKEMVTHVYIEQQSADRAADVLGICGASLERFLNNSGIPRIPAGGYRPSKALWDILQIPVKELEQMNSKEISKATGVSRETVTRLMKAFNYKFKKGGNGSFRKGHVEKVMALPREEVANMTSLQIANKIGCSNKHAQFILNREEIEYIKLQRGRKNVLRIF